MLQLLTLACLLAVAAEPPAVEDVRPILRFDVARAEPHEPASLNQFDRIPVEVYVEGHQPDWTRPAPPLDVEALGAPVVILMPTEGGDPVRVPLNSEIRSHSDGSEWIEVLSNGTNCLSFSAPSATWKADLRQLRPDLKDGTYNVTVELATAQITSQPVQLTLSTVTFDEAKKEATPTGEGHAWIDAVEGPAKEVVLRNETGRTILIYADRFGQFDADRLRGRQWVEIDEMKQPLATPTGFETYRPGGWQRGRSSYCGVGSGPVAVPDRGRVRVRGGTYFTRGIHRYALIYSFPDDIDLPDPNKREYRVAASAAFFVEESPADEALQ